MIETVTLEQLVQAGEKGEHENLDIEKKPNNTEKKS